MGRYSVLGIFWLTSWFAANLAVSRISSDETWRSFVALFALLTFAVGSSIALDRGYFEVADRADGRQRTTNGPRE